MNKIIYDVSNKKENKSMCLDWNFLFVLDVLKCQYEKKSLFTNKLVL